MKKYLLLFFITLSHLYALAQESIIPEANDPILQKYIDLAFLNAPAKIVADATFEKAQAQKVIATMGLFDIFNAGYYYSPAKNTGLVPITSSGSGSTNLVMQGFQFGVSANLGSLLSRPATIKAAKADYKIAKAQHDDYRLTLINNVKSNYYDYLAAKKQLELITLGAKDLKSILNNAQTQFQNGTITIDVYTAAKSASISADAGVLNAEVSFLKSKNALENIIGSKLEMVQ
ncbi:MAG: TolC family protein [Niabella sp.]